MSVLISILVGRCLDIDSLDPLDFLDFLDNEEAVGFVKAPLLVPAV
jgi:hypothetical protein